MKLQRMITVFCWLMVTVKFVIAAQLRIGKSTIMNIDCKNNEALCRNLTCVYSRNINGTSFLTFGCVLTQTFTQVHVRVKSSVQNGRKLITNIEQTLDFCKISEGAGHPLINTFVPTFKEQLSSVLHPCPYKEDIMVKNFSIRALNLPLFLASSVKHRTDLSFLNHKYATIFSLHIFEETK